MERLILKILRITSATLFEVQRSLGNPAATAKGEEGLKNDEV